MKMSKLNMSGMMTIAAASIGTPGFMWAADPRESKRLKDLESGISEIDEINAIDRKIEEARLREDAIRTRKAEEKRQRKQNHKYGRKSN